MRQILTRLYNRDGAEVVYDSKKAAAKTLGIAVTTLNRRLKDGYPTLGFCKGIYIETVKRRGVQSNE